MRPILPALAAFGLLLLGGGPAAAQSGDDAAYGKVRGARDTARRFGDDESLAAFERAADTFLKLYRKSPHASVVQLWRGDLLKDRRPRDAYAAYRASREPQARERAREIAFRHEAPPAFAVERWIGKPADPAGTGSVTLVAFYSETHPQRRRLEQLLKSLDRRCDGRGLRVVGIAAVVDDHVNQTPEQLAPRLEERALPFPVGIDRQRPGPSETLARYRGNRVPWHAVLDRYGRLDSYGPLYLQPNAIETLRARLEELLEAPTFDALAEAVAAGDGEALAKLTAVRTKGAAGALLDALARDPPEELRTRILEAARTLLPEPWADLPSAELAAKWREKGWQLRYDFGADRLR